MRLFYLAIVFFFLTQAAWRRRGAYGGGAAAAPAVDAGAVRPGGAPGWRAGRRLGAGAGVHRTTRPHRAEAAPVVHPWRFREAAVLGDGRAHGRRARPGRAGAARRGGGELPLPAARRRPLCRRDQVVHRAAARRVDDARLAPGRAAQRVGRRARLRLAPAAHGVAAAAPRPRDCLRPRLGRRGRRALLRAGMAAALRRVQRVDGRPRRPRPEDEPRPSRAPARRTHLRATLQSGAPRARGHRRARARRARHADQDEEDHPRRVHLPALQAQELVQRRRAAARMDRRLSRQVRLVDSDLRCGGAGVQRGGDARPRLPPRKSRPALPRSRVRAVQVPRSVRKGGRAQGARRGPPQGEAEAAADTQAWLRRHAAGGRRAVHVTGRPGVSPGRISRTAGTGILRFLYRRRD